MMNFRQRLNRLVLGLSVIIIGFCGVARSQQAPTAIGRAGSPDELAIVDSPRQPYEATASIAHPQSATPQSATQAGSSGTTSVNSADETSDKTWHYYGTAYLWVPEMYGTVGVRGYDTNVHVTTGELFSNFRGGFLGVFTPSYNRFSAPVDVLWMRLRASKPVPSEAYPGYSVRATLNESIVTPKVNYLAVNNPKLKIYGTAGARVWHIGTTLNLIPVVTGTFPYKGVTWTDFVLGARFNVPLGTKASVDILGDGGEGSATLDYQIGGIVNLQLKPKLTSQVGWRYLVEHYGNDGNILNTTTQGIVFGATYKFK